MISQGDLVNRFSYHPAGDGGKIAKHEHVRHLLFSVAAELNEIVPNGRELSLTITHLEEAMMWANAGIARNE